MLMKDKTKKRLYLKIMLRRKRSNNLKINALRLKISENNHHFKIRNS